MDIRNEIESNLLLHVAVENTSASILLLLLKCLSNNSEIIAKKDHLGKSALHLAVQQKKLGCCTAIIQQCPNSLMIKDKDGNTPMHYIAKIGFLGACQEAVKYGSVKHLSEINTKNEMPIHIASRENHKAILELLLKKEVKPDPKARMNYTPLHYACENGSPECVKLIVDSVSDPTKKSELINAKTKSKSTPLIIAANKGFRSCCLQLEGADLDIKDNTGSTALHYAALKGYLSIVQWLLEQDARVDIANNNHQTALYSSACGPNEDCLRLLLEKVGEVDDTTAQKLLHVATKKNHDGGLRVLLDHPQFASFINHAPDGGNTLLHTSLKKGNFNIAKLLLERGARKDVCNDAGEYPLHLAAEQMKVKSRIADEDRRQVCKHILTNSHPLVHKVNKHNESPLHLAAKSGNVEMLRSLLKKGSKILGKDKRGYTPIHVAAENGHAETLKRLIKDLASYNKKDLAEIKPHPLHVAAQKGNQNCCEVIISELKVRNCTVYFLIYF